MMPDILINSLDNQLSILSEEVDTILNSCYKLQNYISIANYINLEKATYVLQHIESTMDNYFSLIVNKAPKLSLKNCEDLINIITVKEDLNTVNQIIKPFCNTKRLTLNPHSLESSKDFFPLLYKINLNSQDYIQDSAVDTKWFSNIIVDLKDCLVNFQRDYTKNLKDEVLKYCKDNKILFAINLLKLVKIVENTIETLTLIIKFLDLTYL